MGHQFWSADAIVFIVFLFFYFIELTFGAFLSLTINEAKINASGNQIIWILNNQNDALIWHLAVYKMKKNINSKKRQDYETILEI